MLLSMSVFHFLCFSFFSFLPSLAPCLPLSFFPSFHFQLHTTLLMEWTTRYGYTLLLMDTWIPSRVGYQPQGWYSTQVCVFGCTRQWFSPEHTPREEFLCHGGVIGNAGFCNVIFQGRCSICLPKVIVYMSSIIPHPLPCSTFSECVYFANQMEIVYHVVVLIYVFLKGWSGSSFQCVGATCISLLTSPSFLMACAFPINAGFICVLDTHRLNPLFKTLLFSLCLWHFLKHRSSSLQASSHHTFFNG